MSQRRKWRGCYLQTRKLFTGAARGREDKELIRGREQRAREQEGLSTKGTLGRPQDCRAGAMAAVSQQTKPRPPGRNSRDPAWCEHCLRDART